MTEWVEVVVGVVVVAAAAVVARKRALAGSGAFGEMLSATGAADSLDSML